MDSDGKSMMPFYRPLSFSSIDVSIRGEVAFVSDLMANEVENIRRERLKLYLLDVEEGTPVESDTVNPDNPLRNITPNVYKWSPDGRYLLYRDQGGIHQVLNRETLESHVAWEDDQMTGGDISLTHFVWSYDNKYIAVTTEQHLHEGDNSRHETHILIVDLQTNSIEPLLR